MKCNFLIILSINTITRSNKMKNRFNTIDTIAVVFELQKLTDSRVNQVYDIDNKTYLIKLNAPDSSKITLLFESGVRIHTTKCDWPKNPTPSGFTMKLRKHIRNKRIVKIEQLGCDRIIDVQFGSGEAAYHLLLEFFNRGNVVLTDHEFTIISLLRVYSDGENHHFATRVKYPIDRARERKNLTFNDIEELLKPSKKNEQIRKCLLPSIDFGASFLEHCLSKVGINPDLKVTSPSIVEELHEKLVNLIEELNCADALLFELKNNGPKGYISCIKKANEQGEEFTQMIEFNPYAFFQNRNYETKVFDSFTDAVDEYFSKLESQKLQLSVIEKEAEAMRKVNKIRADQESRLNELSQKQLSDKIKADRIMNNASIVEAAIHVVRYAIAAQMPWASIDDLIEEAKRRNDPVAVFISKTKFQFNQICMMLSDPFADADEDNIPVEVDIDLSLSAHANATRYYDHKKHAAIKEKKTLESQKKALKSAEKKAREILKTVKTQVAITVSRKVYWFEKFFWFISSDNYLVIGGRDQKQNELIVKRYMKTGDIYVHADLMGASSIVIKNPSGAPVPPRTLDEAGHMAVCYSNAWDTKIICRAWWVYSNQVSKTAPSGEYLVTGSFMIRGQKNFLLPTHLQLGFSFLFRIEESSCFRHVDERKPKLLQEGLDYDSTIIRPDRDVTDQNMPDDLSEEIEEEIHIDDEAHDDDDDVDDDNDDVYEQPERTDSNKLTESHAEKVFFDGAEEAEKNITADKNQEEGNKKQEINETINSIFSECAKENYDHAPVMIVTSQSQEKNIVNDENIDICGNSGSGEVDGKPDKVVSVKDSSATVRLKHKSKTVTFLSNELKYSTNSDEVQNSAAKTTSKNEKKDDQSKNVGKLKRGQKSKLKKIKEKYKDQDEEEKQLRMSILQSAGPPKKPDKKNSKTVSKKQNKKANNQPSVTPHNETLGEIGPATQEMKGEIEQEREVTTELDMLHLLTGQPHPEDELLYAMPVVAPYNAVLNYKFKMKIIPGTSKRGKTARIALEYFLRSKDCTSLEKDLLKCVNDQSLSRNFPGKVKLLSSHPKKK